MRLELWLVYLIPLLIMTMETIALLLMIRFKTSRYTHYRAKDNAGFCFFFGFIPFLNIFMAIVVLIKFVVVLFRSIGAAIAGESFKERFLELFEA